MQMYNLSKKYKLISLTNEYIYFSQFFEILVKSKMSKNFSKFRKIRVKISGRPYIKFQVFAFL